MHSMSKVSTKPVYEVLENIIWKCGKDYFQSISNLDSDLMHYSRSIWQLSMKLRLWYFIRFSGFNHSSHQIIISPSVKGRVMVDTASYTKGVTWNTPISNYMKPPNFKLGILFQPLVKSEGYRLQRDEFSNLKILISTYIVLEFDFWHSCGVWDGKGDDSIKNELSVFQNIKIYLCIVRIWKINKLLLFRAKYVPHIFQIWKPVTLNESKIHTPSPPPNPNRITENFSASSWIFGREI